MNTSALADSVTSPLDAALNCLADGAGRFSTLSCTERADLASQCLASLSAQAAEWVRLSCDAKKIADGSGAVAEEITSGPVAVARYLQLIQRSLREIGTTGKPRLPNGFRTNGDRFEIPVFPTKSLFDKLLFPFLKAEIWSFREEHTQPQFALDPLLNPQAGVSLVLGAGNVSAVAATDALTRIFQEGKAVLLKMNPVLSYLTPVFERAFQPLVDADVLRVVNGDVAFGCRAMNDDRIQDIQITGSVHSHDAIVWGTDDVAARKQAGTPLLNKPITSELGNVTPWIVVPGKYSARQLKFQAENVAASITNNAAFNCLATRVVVTAKTWPQRAEFLALLQQALKATPRRFAYYPGACDRFGRLTGQQPAVDQFLPWTLMENVVPEDAPELFAEESFTCIAVETTLDAPETTDFLSLAAEFCNDVLYGTLCANVTVPNVVRSQQADDWKAFLTKLEYGAIAVNQWVGLSYALMSPPWGGYPNATLTDIQSGIGFVHNTYCLDNVEKCVLSGPLTMLPKPIWFASHGRPIPIAEALQRIFLSPGIGNLIRLLPHTLRG